METKNLFWILDLWMCQQFSVNWNSHLTEIHMNYLHSKSMQMLTDLKKKFNLETAEALLQLHPSCKALCNPLSPPLLLFIWCNRVISVVTDALCVLQGGSFFCSLSLAFRICKEITVLHWLLWLYWAAHKFPSFFVVTTNRYLIADLDHSGHPSSIH